MTEVKHDIKETKELLAEVFHIAAVVKKIAKDGLEAKDLLILVDEIKNIEMHIEAFKGLSLLDDEIKDIDEKEAVELLMLVLSSIKEFKEA